MDNLDLRNMILTLRRDAMYRECNVAARKRTALRYAFRRWSHSRKLLKIKGHVARPWSHWADDEVIMGEIGEIMSAAFQAHLMTWHRN